MTPPDFRFSVKQHLELEHSWERTVVTMRDLIKPLVEVGKLGAIVAELPSWFQYSQSSRKRLATLCERLRDLPLAIEFNRSDWYRKRVVDGLRARGVAMVSVQTDTPKKTRIAPISRIAVRAISGTHARCGKSGEGYTAATPIRRTISTPAMAPTTVKGPTQNRRFSSTLAPEHVYRGTTNPATAEAIPIRAAYKPIKRDFVRSLAPGFSPPRRPAWCRPPNRS